MRPVLIDECINPRLASSALSPPECFEVFVTVDMGFEFEQNLKRLSFGIMVLATANNQIASYERMLDELVQVIRSVGAGQVVRVSDQER